MVITKFDEYKILDMAHGEKLESWNGIILRRPDPQVIWNTESNPELWKKADAIYHRSSTGGGAWDIKNKITNSWEIKYKDLTFNLKLMGFKHTGLFPEQASNWDFMIDKIKNSNRKIKVLNLFAYTGGATVACAYAGADVVHVDSSRGMVDWAKENIKSSNLEDKYVRFIVDDVIKFVEREIRRGNKYDAIIMDPPSYGRGANGEVWSLENDLEDLIKLCKEILADNFLFFIINTYSTNLPLISLENILKINFKDKKITVDDLCLPIENSNLYLSCGITGRITNE